MSINILFCWLLHNKYSFYRVWKQVHAACLEKSEFRLAQICGLNIIVHAVRSNNRPTHSYADSLFFYRRSSRVFLPPMNARAISMKSSI